MQHRLGLVLRMYNFVLKSFLFIVNLSCCPRVGSVVLKIMENSKCTPQGPHSDILMTGGGGVQQVHILYPQKIPTSEFAEAQWTLVREETHLK